MNYNTYARLTRYLCWACGKPCTGVMSSSHYENPEQKVYFCSVPHFTGYLTLKNL